MPIYTFNGETYNVPENEASNFEQSLPDAKISYSHNGERYDVPVKEKSNFLGALPHAKYYEETSRLNPKSNEKDGKINISSPKVEKPVHRQGFSPMQPNDLQEMAVRQPEAQQQKRTIPNNQAPKAPENWALDMITKGQEGEDFYSKANKAVDELPVQHLPRTVRDDVWDAKNVLTAELQKPEYEKYMMNKGTEGQSMQFQPKAMYKGDVLETAMSFLDRSQEMIDAEKDRGWIGNTIHGFGEKFFNSETWTQDVKAMADNLGVMNAVKKLEANKTLTPEEDKLIDAAALFYATGQAAQISSMYKIGSGAAASIPFMLEMVVGGEIGLLGKGATAVESGLMKRFLSRYGVKGATKQLLSRGVDAAKLVGTIQLPRAISGVVDRVSGDVVKDEDGMIHVENKQAMGSAIYKSLMSSTIDNFTEMTGGVLEPVMSKIGGRMAGTAIGEAIQKIPAIELLKKIKTSDVSKAIDGFMEKTQWQGVIPEYLEEVQGTILNSMLTGEANLSDLLDVRQQLETFGTVALMGGFISGAKTIGVAGEAASRYNARKNFDKSKEIVSTIQGYEVLDNGTDEDKINFIQSLPKQDAANALLYAAAKANLDGLNIAVQNRSNEKANEAAEGVMANANVDTGMLHKAKLDDGSDIIVIGGNVEDPNSIITIRHEDGKTEQVSLERLSDFQVEDPKVLAPQAADEARNQVVRTEAEAQAFTPESMPQQGQTIVLNGVQSVIEGIQGDQVVINDGTQQLTVPLQKVREYLQTESGNKNTVAPQATVGSTFTIEGKNARVESTNADGVVYSVLDQNNEVEKTDRISHAQFQELAEPAQNQTMPVNAEVGVVSSATGVEGNGTAENAASVPTFPTDKQGSIDFAQINEPQQYTEALRQEFGEEAEQVADEMVQDATTALEKAGKVSGTIERRRAVKAAQAEVEKATAVKAAFGLKNTENIDGGNGGENGGNVENINAETPLTTDIPPTSTQITPNGGNGGTLSAIAPVQPTQEPTITEAQNVVQPELKSETDGQRLDAFKQGDTVYRNYSGKYQEFTIDNAEGNLWELTPISGTTKMNPQKFNAVNNGGFMLKQPTPENVSQPVLQTSTIKKAKPAKKKKPSETEQRISALGEILSVHDYVLRSIAGGLRLKWKSEEGKAFGLAKELGFEKSETERRKRIGIIANNGTTPTEWAENIFAEADILGIPLNGLDENSIREEIIDVVRSFVSRQDMLKAVEDLHTGAVDSQAEYLSMQYNEEKLDRDLYEEVIAERYIDVTSKEAADVQRFLMEADIDNIEINTTFDENTENGLQTDTRGTHEDSGNAETTPDERGDSVDGGSNDTQQSVQPDNAADRGIQGEGTATQAQAIATQSPSTSDAGGSEPIAIQTGEGGISRPVNPENPTEQAAATSTAKRLDEEIKALDTEATQLRAQLLAEKRKIGKQYAQDNQMGLFETAKAVSGLFSEDELERDFSDSNISTILNPIKQTIKVVDEKVKAAKTGRGKVISDAILAVRSQTVLDIEAAEAEEATTIDDIEGNFLLDNLERLYNQKFGKDKPLNRAEFVKIWNDTKESRDINRANANLQELALSYFDGDIRAAIFGSWKSSIDKLKAIAKAEAEVNTEPTEAQKEATPNVDSSDANEDSSQVENASFANTFNDWQENNGNVSDLVPEIEAYLLNADNANDLDNALEAWREEYAYDKKLSGRGDMDSANDALVSAAEKHISKTIESVGKIADAEQNKPTESTNKSDNSLSLHTHDTTTDENNPIPDGTNGTLEDGRESTEKTPRNDKGTASGTLKADRTQGGTGTPVEGNDHAERGERGRSERTDVGNTQPELLPTDQAGTDSQRKADGSDKSNPSGNITQGGPRNTRNNRIAKGEDLAPRGEVAKTRANLSAIRLAKKLRDSGTAASAEDMAVLRKYAGWGGLAASFKPDNQFFDSLKNLLTEDEYESARQSTTTSFYTPTEVIASIWDMISHMGFKGGSILEPAAGIGHFIGMMPEGISANSDIRGVELDNISGMIAKLLYPDAKIDVSGFEEQRIKNNSLDLVVTNVPFGDFKVHDTNEKDLSGKFDIHDYFIAKSIRKLKAGGIGVFITTSSTMDKSAALRNWIINEGSADFIDAFRLNSDTFKAVAGTEATADIIIIRKRSGLASSEHGRNMQDAVTQRTATYEAEIRNHWGSYIGMEEKKAVMRINRHFNENPDRMAGEMKFGFEDGNAIRPTEQRLAPVASINQEKALETFTQSLPKNITNTDKTDEKAPNKQNNGTKEGGLTMIDGNPYIIRFGEAVAADWNTNKVAGQTKLQAVTDYLAVKNAINSLLKAENEDASNIEDLRKDLNTAYTAFVKKYGYMSENQKIGFLADDVDYPSVQAIENAKPFTDEATGKRVFKITKSDIFTKRVITPSKVMTADNIRDGVNVSIYMHGAVNVPYIAELLGKTEQEAEAEILSSREGFMNPATGMIDSRDNYLSGNVRKKLELAEQSNQNGELDANIEELGKIIPHDIPMHLISVALGTTWIPTKVYEKFFLKHFDVSGKINKTSNDTFQADLRGEGNYTDRQMGMTGANASELALNAMNNKQTTIYTYEWRDNQRVRVKDALATAQAIAKQGELNELFQSWSRGSENPYAEEMAGIFNETFNATVEAKTDVSTFEHFEGAAKVKTPRTHQKEGVLRGLAGATLLAHEVGTGKTITLISTAMEMRRLGLAKKPVIIVQRSTYKQFVAEILEMYPNAKVLAPSAKDLTAAQRQQLFAKIAYNDWDIVVLYHSYLDGIPDDPDRVNQYIDDQIQEKMELLNEVVANGGKDVKMLSSRIKKEIENLEAKKEGAEAKPKKGRSVKDEEKAKQKARSKSEKLLDRRQDKTFTFEQLGVDALLIDEAHAYKRLGFNTNLQGVKGIDTNASQKAQSTKLKTSFILENNQGRNVVFATGTPISNTMAEMWTFLRYLLPKSELERLQIKNFDAFVNNFGVVEESSEFGTNGKFKVTNRFSSYTNVPELLAIWKKVTHTVLTRNIDSLKEGVGTPRVEGGKPQDIMLEQGAPLKGVMKHIKTILTDYEHMTGKEKKENSHIPLVMFGMAKRAAIDVRLVNPKLPDDANSKLNRAVQEILKDLSDTNDYRGVVAIFCDAYQSSDKSFNVFKDVSDKLIARGIPASQIAIINDSNTDDKRDDLFVKLNTGEVRVVFGTTEKLGVGVNIQERLHTVIHLDAPARPSDYEQRNGRIIRQNNMHLDMDKPVRILRIGVKQTLDVTGYQRLEIKGKFIRQIMSGDVSSRTMEEVDMEGSDSSNFSEMMATLSGSQAALQLSLTKNKLRKLLNARDYHRQNQVHIAGKIKDNKNIISTTGMMIDKLEAEKKAIQDIFGTGVESVQVGNKIARSEEELETLFASLDKKMDTEAEALKKGNQEQSVLKFSLLVNGKKFDITAKLMRTLDVKGAGAYRVSKFIDFKSVDMPQVEKISGARIQNVVRDIASIIACEYQDKEIQKRKIGVERAMSENQFLEPQLGKSFEKEDELEKVTGQIDELETQMKDELAVIEATEADDNIEAIDFNIDEDQTGAEDDILLREGEAEPIEEIDNQASEDIKGQAERVEQLSDPDQGEERSIRQEAEALSRRLNVDLNFVDDVETLPKGSTKRKSKGWYDPATGKVYVVLANNTDIADVQKTILHEIVGHKGLRNLLGDRFERSMEDIFDSLPEYVQETLLKKYGDNVRAAEEYASQLAETLDKPSVRARIVASFRNTFRRFGINLQMKDADVMYLLWKSKNRLTGGNSVFDVADHSVKSKEILTRLKEDESVIASAEQLNRTINQDKLRESYQDRMISVSRLVETMEKRGQKVPDWMNAYLFENHVTSISTYEVEQYKKNMMEPIFKELARLSQAAEHQPLANRLNPFTGKSKDTHGVYNYMLAKHGLERNAKMRAKDELAAISEGLDTDYSNKDYSGLTALAKEVYGERVEPESLETKMQVYVDQYELDHDTKKLWKAVNAATKETLKKWYESGMSTKQQYESIRDMYDYYIPLRGWNEDTASDVYTYLSKDEQDTFNPAVKKAKGRTSRADDPMAFIGSIAESTIVAGNKNQMKQRFLWMARTHKNNDLYSVSKIWFENTGTGKRKRWSEVVPELTGLESVDERNQIIDDFNERMTELQEQGNAKTERGTLHVGLRISKYQEKEHQIKISEGGVEYVVNINGNPSIAQAINGLNNKGAATNGAVKAVNWMNRQMAANFTTRNPTFVIRNLIKDVIYASTMHNVREGVQYKRKFQKNIPVASAAIWRYLRGKADINNQTDQLLQDFYSNGGETGYVSLSQFDKIKKDIQRKIKQLDHETTDIFKPLRIVVDALSVVNRWAEGISRFATFLTSREMGRPIETSISNAKDATVNFNRKGSGAIVENQGGVVKAISALSPVLKIWYLFFNASMQGLQNFTSAGLKHPARFAAGLAKFGAVGVMAPFISAALASILGGDGDDEEKAVSYWDIPSWVRRNNFVLCVGNSYLSIPLPIELRAFYGMGEILTSKIMGKMEDENAGLAIAGSFMDSMSPVDIGKGSFRKLKNNNGEDGVYYGGLFPDALGPVYEAYAANEDWLGYNIAKNSPYTKYVPEFRCVYSGTGKWFIKASEMSNAITGGDNEKKGVIDFNPAKVEHLFNSYFGGVGKTINQMAKLVSKTWDKDMALEVRDVPVVSGFSGEVSERGRTINAKNKFFDTVEDFNQFDYLAKEYFKKRNEPEYAKKLTELMAQPDAQQMVLVREYKKAYDELTTMRKNTEKDPNSTPADLSVADDYILDLMERMNNEIDILKNGNKKN